MDPDAKYTFTNPNLGAFFAVHKVPLSFESLGNLVVIQAPKTDDVYRLAAQFNDNGEVPVISFIAELQKIKQKIYAMRGTILNG